MLMQNKIIDDIIAYINYLINGLKLNVSLCRIGDNFGSVLHLLYPYNSHRTEYCQYIKSSADAHKRCIACQNKVLQIFSNGQNDFSGICWAGVRDYVFPIRSENKIVGFVSVSGYKSTSAPTFENIADDYGLDDAALQSKYRRLQTAKPNTDFLKTLIHPLCRMLAEQYLIVSVQGVAPNALYTKIVDYICSNYQNSDLSLDDVANHCGYGESHIRHVFFKYSGYSVRRYITMLRIKLAEELLSTTNLSVRDIAYDTGFNDSNYFTNVFHKSTGVSPNAYRKNMKNGVRLR